MSKQQLINRARELGVARFTKLSREELVAAIAREERVLALAEERKAETARRDAAAEAYKAECAERAARRAGLNLTEFWKMEGESDWARSVVHRATKAEAELAAAKERFLTNLEQDPTYAMSWSMSMFEATAEAAVASEILYNWKAGMCDAKLMKMIINRMSQAAKSGRSTSPTSNLVDQCQAAAWAAYSDEWVL